MQVKTQAYRDRVGAAGADGAAGAAHAAGAAGASDVGTDTPAAGRNNAKAVTMTQPA